MKKLLTKLITGVMFLTVITAPAANLNVSAAGNKISGYIRPSFTTTNSSLYSNFNVIASENGKSAMTDVNGYFEISDVASSQSGYTIRISKSGYLTRTITAAAGQGNIVLGSPNSPVGMLAGDITQDRTINTNAYSHTCHISRTR
ncbi:hypothetical protein [Pseudobacteroides cellulosolvens]|uniref:Uncharacterized protein n=1 Tax=Pseudobacteroides cellulosolvens ATCC 35603 = DSM 2933 TaxID=398512 RepID=A0A0L6JWJ7_9FIRM|nr:hypothetical protein [Pseudobacteroides cellulosolvens]KNY29990.1 hypothetical protein Bccel_5267 [Pseudobacteroides cellulosolvens ATCC 35603 = DSM 2933]